MDGDGTKYEGGWKEGLKHGQGLLELPNGTTYEGQFSNGGPDGRGSFKGLNGNRYTGEWKDSLAHGKGIHTFPNGDKYEGEWDAGAMQGYGKFILAAPSESGEESSCIGEWIANGLVGTGQGTADGRYLDCYMKDGEIEFAF